MSKKIICALLALVLIIGLVPVSAIPASAASDGSCGASLKWKFSGDTLTITGSGAMKAYASKASIPWKDHLAKIKYVSFPKGLTEISSGAFSQTDYPNLLAVVVEDTGAWAQVKFNGTNPLSFAHNMYLQDSKGNRQLITNLTVSSTAKQISSYAFSGGYFESVVLPNTVKSIGEAAFYGSPNLTSVSMKEGLTSIGNSAFQNCSALTSVTIPNSVTKIGSYAFSNTAQSALKSVTLGSKLESIGSYAFAGNKKLAKVTIPNKVTEIGVDAFNGCTGLKSVTLSTALKAIKGGVFANTGITEITIPASVTSLDASAFTGCASLTTINAASLTAWCKTSFLNGNPLQNGAKLFVGGKFVEDVVIPTGVLEVRDNAFKGYKYLKSVTFKDYVTRIGANAFTDCSNLTDVYVDRKAQWEDLLATMGAGNDPLKSPGLKVHFIDPSVDPVDPPKPNPENKLAVDERLVEMVIGQTPFYATARETYKGSGKYIIGYGTPAVFGQKITKEQAKNVLREHLEVAAAKVEEIIPGLSATRRDALAAFTVHNGYGWLGGSPMLTYISSHKAHAATYQPLLHFAGTSVSHADYQMKNRLAEANLYINGEYALSANYGYVVLNPNGGNASYLGTAMGYDLRKNVSIDTEYAPTRLGYDFIGWYTNSAANSGKLVVALDDSTNGKTLYAHWEPHNGNVDDNEITGRPVGYKLPALLADTMTWDSNGRVKVFAKPCDSADPSDYKTKYEHISTIELNSVMDVVAEYKHPLTHHLWVRLRNSGWVNLGTYQHAVESGVVQLQPKQKLNIHASIDPESKVVGSLRNGDPVSIFYRETVKKKEMGMTVFLNAETNTYNAGFVDLAYVNMTPSTDGQTEPEVPSDSPNGKPPIGDAVVSGTDFVNIRDSASVYGKYLGKLGRSKPVVIYDKTVTNGVDWALTNKGWICMLYLTETKPSVDPDQDGSNDVPYEPGDVGTADNTKPLAKGQVIANITLNIRENPGPQAKKVGTISNGARFTVFQTKMYNGAQWGRMEKGWICLTYTHLDGDITISGGERPKPSKPEILSKGRVVNCSTHVNVRASATPQSALQGTYSLGSVIDLLEKTENNGFDWYRTNKGWVCGTYVQPFTAPDPKPVDPVIPQNPSDNTVKTGIVSANVDVNVREAAGVQNNLVTKLRSGSRVNILGSETVNGVVWYKIDQGWISSQYVIVGGSINGGVNNGLEGSAGTTETAKGQYATGTVAQSGLQVRAGAGFGYQKLKTLNEGADITIYEQRLQDGVAWGRIGNNSWVNLAFVTLDSTGITGTGTMGTVVRCGHAVNVRSTPSTSGARMATLLIGAPVEVLEVKDMDNGESWGRTPQGWINMYYIQLTGEIPAPPIPDPVEPTDPKPVEPSKPKPDTDKGTSLVLQGVMLEDSMLRMVPGVMGDFDASIAMDQVVKIRKVAKVDGSIWGLLEAGWVNMDKVDLNTFVVSGKAQLVWKEPSTTTAVRAINQGEMVNISELDIDTNGKVWASIGANEWIELTGITQPENYGKSFLVKATTTKDDIAVRGTPSEEAAAVGENLAIGTEVLITGLEKDVNGNLWGRVSNGWVNMKFIAISSNGKVTAKTLVSWTDRDKNFAKDVLKQGQTVNITKIVLNNVGTPMGYDSLTKSWMELASVTVI